MKIHVFNPEHDIALANNVQQFTAPHNVRLMRKELGFLPALWASDGDIVLVDEVEAAAEAARHLGRRLHDVTFLTANELQAHLPEDVSDVTVLPWGWDGNVRDQMLKADSRLAKILPSDDDITTLREISNRKFAAANVLPALRNAERLFIGESNYCESIPEVERLVDLYGQCVLKAPWSCSGRGIRYVYQHLEEQQYAWAENVISRQGGIMVEPKYNKVKDFGAEFFSDGKGTIECLGLSVFRTINGAYAGNLLATEKDKRDLLRRYVSVDLLATAIFSLRRVLSPLLKDRYKGMFGVDMMVVSSVNGTGFLLHPCVEINFRMTMGHVALALSPSVLEPQRLMHIGYDGHFHFRISSLKTNNQQ